MSVDAANASGSGWAEPPWSGFIETTGDALLILEAARRGMIPRVTRRLVDAERKLITSGSVFVFDEDESGIKRWTDGFYWSPSRILGNFLLYRETDKRVRSQRGADVGGKEAQDPELEATNRGGDFSAPRHDEKMAEDLARERALMGSLTNSYKFKRSGMMKKTFSLTINGVAQHLISYYKPEDVEAGRLRTPSSLPELLALEITPEYLDKTHFRCPPRIEVGPDGIPRYRGENEDEEGSPSPRAALTTLPYERRVKRHDPYASAKRTRKGKSASISQPVVDETWSSQPEAPSSSSSPTRTEQKQWVFHDESHAQPYSPSYAHQSYPSPSTSSSRAHPPYDQYAGAGSTSYVQYASQPPVVHPQPSTSQASYPPYSVPPYYHPPSNPSASPIEQSYPSMHSYPSYGTSYSSAADSSYENTDSDGHLPVEASA